MRNLAIPTHIALTQEQAGKIDWSLNYAKAILTLIQNDSPNNESDEPEEFFTSTSTIKTAISAVQHFLEVAEENRKSGIYCNIELERVSGNAVHPQQTEKGGMNNA